MKKSIINRLADRKGLAEATEAASAQSRTPSSGSDVIANSSPVANMGRALSQIAGERVVALDPSKIDRSPFQDRFDADEESEAAIEALKISIRAEGQKIPVLVRQHPTEAGRYQLAYGFRRLEAIKRINSEAVQDTEQLKVRAYIRKLDDHALAKEQSLENGLRKNLSWIEQALWAQRLQDLGLQREEIGTVMGKSKSALSLFLKVAEGLPRRIVLSIGRAEKSGRPKWLRLVEAFQDDGALERVDTCISSPKFSSAASDKRLDLLIRAAEKSARTPESKDEIQLNGKTFAIATRKAKSTNVAIPDQNFADWLISELPALAKKYEEEAK